MANNDIIRHDDIAESGALKPFQDELLATLVILRDFDTQIIKIATDIKKSLGNSDTSSVKGIEKLTEATKLSNIAFTEREKLIRQTRETEAKLAENTSEYAKHLAEVRVEMERVNAANKEQAKFTSSTTGAYQKASIELNKARRAWKDLAIVHKENSAEAKLLKTRIDELDGSLKRVDAAAGQHQRNVGNYASGYDGLRNSINQLTREAPAFANSFNTGIMALTNNIPILADQIAMLKQKNLELQASGQTSVPVWKQVLSSFLSWQTALSAGIAIMALYGKEIGQAIGGMFGFRDATKEMSEAQAEFNELLKTGVERVDNLTREQLEDVQFQTKQLVIAAKVRGATVAEIRKIEEEGRKKELAVLEQNIDNQVKIMGDAATSIQDLQNKINFEFGHGNDADKIKALKDEIANTQTAYEAARSSKIASERAMHTKSHEMLVVANQQNLDDLEKARKAAAALQRKISEDLIAELKRRLDEIEKYQKLAEKYGDELFKEQQKLRQKEKDEYKTVSLFKEDIEANLNAAADIANARTAKREQAQRKQRATDLKNASSFLETLSKQRTTAIEKQTEQEISASVKRQSDLKEVAMRGVADANNTLAFEERKQAELEQKRAKQQRAKGRRELLFAGLKAYSSYIEKNPGAALTKTLKDLSLLTASISSLPGFYEGTENVAKSMGKPQFQGRDGYMARLDGGERVLTGDQNRKIGDMSNEELANLAQMARNGIIPSMVNSYNDESIVQTNLVVKKLDDLKTAIENKPVQRIEVDEFAKIASVITESKYKKETTRRKIGGR